jgi:hypothetical protein
MGKNKEAMVPLHPFRVVLWWKAQDFSKNVTNK